MFASFRKVGYFEISICILLGCAILIYIFISYVLWYSNFFIVSKLSVTF